VTGQPTLDAQMIQVGVDDRRSATHDQRLSPTTLTNDYDSIRGLFLRS
jgi:hypothetical protein